MTESAEYDETALGSDDPVERFIEMLRLLNESYLLIDPLYGMMRREPVAAIPRRNMLREDEVFATKLALAGPWRHVPEVLARRNWRRERIGRVAARLGVPSLAVALLQHLAVPGDPALAAPGRAHRRAAAPGAGRRLPDVPAPAAAHAGAPQPEADEDGRGARGRLMGAATAR